MSTERTRSPSTPASTSPIRAGVIGVGSMGKNHARVYNEIPGVELVGVADHDASVAEQVAAEYGTAVLEPDVLRSRCDAVTVAVPTRAHFETVSACLDAGVHVLVEKPITRTVEEGRALAEQARDAGLVLQVGHIERFNPAVQTVMELVDDLDVISLEAERLGPPVDRTARANVIFDLMVHDVDIVGSVLNERPSSISAIGTDDGQYATATMEYDDVVASLTASRVTQKKVRKLTVTARECLVEVDYLEQSVLIYRDSYPEYLTDDGPNRYRHESVVENARVDNGEPLRHELESFVKTVRTGVQPAVTAEDGVRALRTVQAIDSLVSGETPRREQEQEQEVEAR